MSRSAELDLAADDIIDAAVEIFREEGLDAVSMRSVSNRLGVSPIPLYSRIGNKDALVSAMADRLIADVAPRLGRSDTWAAYAMRWTRALRRRMSETRDRRMIAAPTRDAFVAASRPLIEAMRRDGFAADDAVHACRLLTWAAVGFANVESAGMSEGQGVHGVRAAEIDELFAVHIRYLIDGIERDRSAP